MLWVIMTDNQNNIPARSFAALLPLLVFLTVYIGTGIYYTLQGADFAFYQLPAPVAVLPAIVLSLLLAKEPLNKAINRFIGGVGHPDIIAMCMIYLLAGAFSSVAKATGGVDAAVGLGLSVLPGWALLPGLFLIAAVISTAMGTSMGTIAALSPVALGVAQATGISLPLMAGVILSGAMFGDNMSVISDTTIAATRSQGCLMRDKLKENFRIALPAAIATLILFFFLTRSSEVPAAEPFSWILALPYLVILVLALSGLNVFLVLGVGILSAGLIGFGASETYTLGGFARDIYSGFGSMQEIFLLSMLIGGLSELMKQQGGLAFLAHHIQRMIERLNSSGKPHSRAGEMGIALLVALTNCCTANNTVAIIVSGGVARTLAKENQISPRRAASVLDIYSCVVQGLLPYGAQALLLASSFKLSPLDVVTHAWYCVALAISALLFICLRPSR